jgi:phage shock protein PspC (stress-responsive transcriptional regulator)
MKKVEKVSIAEISFTLDNDAYVALKQYLDSLHQYYENDPDGREITRDIEARIAELILEEQVYTKVVSKSLIDTIIAQLGTADQIDDEAGDGVESDGNVGGAAAGYAATGTSSDGSFPRRLHRSTERKVLGGVCSGIAQYLDVNVFWVRLVFLFPLALAIFGVPFHMNWRLENFIDGWFWVFFVIYIVLWIALPMARTPRQKLEARGEKITPASIRHNMQEAANTPAGKKAASVAAEVVTVLGRVVIFFVKLVAAIVGFSLLFSSIAIFMGMIAVFFDPHSAVVANGVSIVTAFEGMAILSPVLFTDLVLLCAMLPLLVVGMALLSFTFSWRLGRLFYGLTLGLWGLAIIFCGIVAASNVRFLHDELPDRIERWSGVEWRHGGHRHDRWEERRTTREAGKDADEVIIDLGVDSMVVVLKKNGLPNDTLRITEREVEGGTWESSENPAPDPSSAPDEAADEVGGRKRIEIRRVD